MPYLTPEAIAAWAPDPPPGPGQTALSCAHEAMRSLGLAGPDQQMGQRWPIGCVALEITQRCNLDCTACYLSEHSEAVRDLPLEVVLRRIDAIRAHYGPGVDVQITGGDPTLRQADELLAIVRRARALGLRSTLMTNGIRASGARLAALARAGLLDVAFHVDTTQERKGYGDEASLNALRERYLARARAAGLSVMFNTTVHPGNVGEVAGLARFFRDHAGEVRTASFQLVADTGRGTLRARGTRVTLPELVERIQAGAGSRLSFDSTRIGHPACTRYALAACIGDETYDVLESKRLVASVQAATARIAMRRDRPLATARDLGRLAARHPALAARVGAHLAARAWRARAALWRARGRVRTVSFVVHDFMHAACLDPARITACVFKVQTEEGPLSMCLHNARRDDHILRPVPLAHGARRWDPLSGRASVDVSAPIPPDPMSHPLKRLKGRSRRRALAARARGPA